MNNQAAGIELILAELQQAKNVLSAFLKQRHSLEAIENAAQMMAKTLIKSGKIISCGNGGSHCDAMHFAEELSGKYRLDRQALAAIALSDPSHITCVGNDYGFDHIFSRGIEALGQSGDVLLAISTSGNSTNIIKAIHAAKAKNMTVIGLSGKDGGLLADLVDIEIRVTHFGFADRIQEVHIKIIHILIMRIEQILWNI